jgi:hypothetical protein
MYNYLVHEIGCAADMLAAITNLAVQLANIIGRDYGVHHTCYKPSA